MRVREHVWRVCFSYAVLWKVLDPKMKISSTDNVVPQWCQTKSWHSMFCFVDTILMISAYVHRYARDYFDEIELQHQEAKIGQPIIKELVSKLQFLSQVGLGYLDLSRTSKTLSGGESQRIRLAAQVGSGLQGITYILDEPSIGLHPTDQGKLLDALERLRDNGNSVLV